MFILLPKHHKYTKKNADSDSLIELKTKKYLD